MSLSRVDRQCRDLPSFCLDGVSSHASRQRTIMEQPSNADVGAGLAPYAMTADEVIRRLDTDASAGLTPDDAARRLEQFGINELTQAPREPWWRRLLRQFADLLIWILIGAALVSGALGEWLDAGAILAIVVLNGVL